MDDKKPLSAHERWERECNLALERLQDDIDCVRLMSRVVGVATKLLDALDGMSSIYFGYPKFNEVDCEPQYDEVVALLVEDMFTRKGFSVDVRLDADLGKFKFTISRTDNSGYREPRRTVDRVDAELTMREIMTENISWLLGVEN